MSDSKQLSASLEDYLETIYWIVKEKGAARAKDIAQKLNVKAGSVTGALQMLAKSGHINYAPYEVITLTDKGKLAAKDVVKKHETLRDFFAEILGIPLDIAEDGACKMEHSVPDEIIERLISFSEYVQSCPSCGNNWSEQFQKFFREQIKSNPDKCGISMSEENSIKPIRNIKVKEGVKEKSIFDLVPGDKCIVQSIKRGSTASKRLTEMGISRGTTIEIERVAPLGDPIEVKVKGYHLSIRKDEAKYIVIE